MEVLLKQLKEAGIHDHELIGEAEQTQTCKDAQSVPLNSDMPLSKVETPEGAAKLAPTPAPVHQNHSSLCTASSQAG